MALPPQIEVPEVIKKPSFLSIFKTLIRSNPRLMVRKIDKAVIINPSLLVLMVSVTDMPKPRPITEIFKSKLMAFLDWIGNGCPKNKEKRNPKTRATVHEIKKRVAKTIIRKYNIIII